MKTSKIVKIMASNLSEWEQFAHDGVLINGEHYIPEDVAGDGNCFYHAVLKSGLLAPIDDVFSLRMTIYTSCMDRIQDLQHYYENHISPASRLNYNNLEDYLEKHVAADGVWANEFDMILFYIAFGIRLTSFRIGFRAGVRFQHT